MASKSSGVNFKELNYNKLRELLTADELARVLQQDHGPTMAESLRDLFGDCRSDSVCRPDPDGGDMSD